MRRLPRAPGNGVLFVKDSYQLGTIGAAIVLVSLGFALYNFKPEELEDLTWQTMVIFTTIGFAQIFQALALKSPAYSPFALWTNLLIAGVVVATILL